jgi:hypothetical protein
MGPQLSRGLAVVDWYCSEDIKYLKQSVETFANTRNIAWTGKSVQVIHTRVIFLAYVAKGTIMYMCRIQVIFCKLD